MKEKKGGNCKEKFNQNSKDNKMLKSVFRGKKNVDVLFMQPIFLFLENKLSVQNPALRYKTMLHFFPFSLLGYNFSLFVCQI